MGCPTACRAGRLQEFARYCADQALGLIPNPGRIQQQMVQAGVRNYPLLDIAGNEPNEKYVWLER